MYVDEYTLQFRVSYYSASGTVYLDNNINYNWLHRDNVTFYRQQAL